MKATASISNFLRESTSGKYRSTLGLNQNQNNIYLFNNFCNFIALLFSRLITLVGCALKMFPIFFHKIKKFNYTENCITFSSLHYEKQLGNE